MAFVRAVLLDRDGTLIEDRHYLADPAGVPRRKGPGEIPGDARGGGPLPAQNSMISSVSGPGRAAAFYGVEPVRRGAGLFR